MSNEYLNNKLFETIINSFQNSKKAKTRHELILEDLADTYERKSKRGIDSPSDAVIVDLAISSQKVLVNEFNHSQDHLALAFYTLSDNIVKYAKFRHIDSDDAVQEGVMICFEKIDRFNPKKGKAFNYMTTCILNHFRQLYRTARNYKELKRKYHEFTILSMSNNGKGSVY